MLTLLHAAPILLCLGGAISSSIPLVASSNTSVVRPTLPVASTSATLATSRNLGDYIASGLGLASTAPSSSSLSSISNSSTGIGTPTDKTAANATTTLPARLPQTNISSVSGTGAIFSNANTTVGLSQCWNSWVSYWSSLPDLGTNDGQTVCAWTYAPTTVEGTTTWTYSQSALTSGEVVTQAYTNIIDDGGFAPSTQTVYDTYTQAGNVKGSTYTVTSAWTDIETSSCISSFSRVSSSPGPNCTLPTTPLAQCQSAWTTWITEQFTTYHMVGTVSAYNPILTTAPSCTQASIGTGLCTSLRDAWVADSLDIQWFSSALPSMNSEIAIALSGGYYRTGEQNWIWPSTAYFAPGCTLGCGGCSIVGGTVQLLYWPATATATSNGTTPSASIRTIATLGTTFTSPTIYVSYHKLYATDACNSTYGTPLYNTILAIPTESALSSIWAMPVGDGYDHGAGANVFTRTASFNVTDLNEPIPMSIYTSRLWCASYAQFNAPTFGSTWDCPRNASYAPIIQVPIDLLRTMEPSWAQCAESYGGVYDPPKALQPASVEAGPTTSVPDGGVSVPPTAAATLPSATPAVTSTAFPTSEAATVQSSDLQPQDASRTSTVSGSSQADTVQSSSLANPTGSESTGGQPVSTSAAAATGSTDPDPQPHNTSGTPTLSGSSHSGTVHSHDPADPTPSDSNDSPTVRTSAATATDGQAATTDTERPDTPTPTETPNSSLDPGSSDSSRTDADPATTDAYSVLASALEIAASQDEATTVGYVVSGTSGNNSPTTPSAVETDPVVFTVGTERFTATVDSTSPITFANAETTFAVTPSATPITIGSYIVSAGDSDAIVVAFGGQSSTLFVAPTANAVDDTMMLGSQAYTRLSQPDLALVNAATTIALTAGAVATFSDGDAISVDGMGSAVIIDGTSTRTIGLVSAGTSPSTAPVATSPLHSEVVTLTGAGKTLTAAIAIAQSSTYVLVGGTSIPLQSDAATVLTANIDVTASGIVVDGSTYILPFTPDSGTQQLATVRIGDQIMTISALSAGVALAAGKTLSVGGMATDIAGETISLASAGVVVDGFTIPWSSSATVSPGVMSDVAASATTTGTSSSGEVLSPSNQVASGQQQQPASASTTTASSSAHPGQRSAGVLLKGIGLVLCLFAYLCVE